MVNESQNAFAAGQSTSAHAALLSGMSRADYTANTSDFTPPRLCGAFVFVGRLELGCSSRKRRIFRPLMQKIKLNNDKWDIDTKSPLGKPGGFGAVFRGMGDDGHVAINRLNITATQACYREMSIGEHLLNRKLSHVVPIYDLGQDAETDRYYIVMPVCDRSLQDAIDEDGPFTVNSAVSILEEILSGLDAVDGIVHRDIKPANILFHEGEWKIADFGIAKFVEDSTSLETLRNSLTPTYAAPEQWREERPTAATDVYALGCIAHTLTTGHPPFSGEISDLKEQHLKVTPQPIEEFPARARALISQMLRKAPEARPSRTRCVHVLKGTSKNDPFGMKLGV